MSQIEDNLSGIVQTFSYCDSGGGRGQVASVSDDNSAVGASDFAASYTYSDEGDRAIATYSKDGVETARWGYRDYLGLGNPTGPSRVFQTLVKLDGSNNPTSEEFQYVYDSVGRLRQAAFAQTPASGFTPDTGNSYYDEDHLASSRARAYYLYDAGGRLTQFNTWWDTWSSGASTTRVSGTGRLSVKRNWERRHLAGCEPKASPALEARLQTDNWTYDPAGNRNDATVVDNLNRATTIGGVSRTYDVLGNTLTIGSSKTMTWDILNRMLSLDNGTTTTDYAYRADGMRVVKETGTKLTSYGYDGQMPVEESLVDSANSNNDSVIRYALGARGVDRISRTTSSGTTTGYPLYDAHGNNVATLSKSGSSYSVGDERSYDVWGGIRAGNTTGDPNPRHCGNLGHLADDESGFVFMRHRYLDCTSGRLLSEDPAKQGHNWFSYCNNNSVSNVDPTGLLTFPDALMSALDEAKEKVAEFKWAEGVKARFISMIELACYEWCEKYITYVVDEQFTYSGTILGTKSGLFQIMFHLTASEALQHETPHIQLAWNGQTIGYFFWNAAKQCFEKASSGWDVP